MKFHQYLHKTHTDKQEKSQGAAALRDDAILIFKLVNFSFSQSDFSNLSAVRSPQRESLSLRTLKFCQYQHETHTDKQEKPQGAEALRNDAIIILKLVNFCFLKSKTCALVWYFTKLLRQKVQVLGQ
jgi:hypothetical protein